MYPKITASPAKPAPDSTYVHTIKKGQTLREIAFANHVSTKDIADINPGLKPESTVRPDQKIKVPTYKNSTWTEYQQRREEYERQVEANKNNAKATEPKESGYDPIGKFCDLLNWVYNLF